jgi:hypothetical protein
MTPSDTTSEPSTSPSTGHELSLGTTSTPSFQCPSPEDHRGPVLDIANLSNENLVATECRDRSDSGYNSNDRFEFGSPYPTSANNIQGINYQYNSSLESTREHVQNPVDEQSDIFQQGTCSWLSDSNNMLNTMDDSWMILNPGFTDESDFYTYTGTPEN